jgi:uroporphyrinogen-III decarboxylase
MDPDRFRALAADGLRTAIATDLVLHERADPEAARADGRHLAQVVLESARRQHTPLAVPLMDLRLEREDLVLRLRPGEDPERFQFLEPPTAADHALARETANAPLGARQQAQCDAIAAVAALGGDPVPLGMAIGPFSLATRLVADPIAAVALAGAGLVADDEPLVAAFEGALRLAEGAVRRSLAAQLRAGAAAVIVCEPAASSLYVSPLQVSAGSPVFETLVVEPLLRLKALLDEHGAFLFLHDCGELVQPMLEALAQRVRPAVLSLGSSRRLWEDAALVPEDVVLYGNLPTRHFHSDETLPLEAVREKTRELLSRMAAIGRPFILGSECDVLHVPGAQARIHGKLEAMLSEGRSPRAGH